MSYKFNPLTGKLDKVGQTTGVVNADVASTIVTREAAEAISALRMVIVNSDNTVSYADSDLTFEDAKTLGMAITSGAIGQDVRIVTFGIVEDASFVYSVNDQLYLSDNGNIKTNPPVIPDDTYNVFIGQALGLGQIFISVQEPIEL